MLGEIQRLHKLIEIEDQRKEVKKSIKSFICWTNLNIENKKQLKIKCENEVDKVKEEIKEKIENMKQKLTEKCENLKNSFQCIDEISSTLNKTTNESISLQQKNKEILESKSLNECGNLNFISDLLNKEVKKNLFN